MIRNRSAPGEKSFGDDLVEHRLAPGENLKIAASRFKSIVINESTASLGPRQVRRPPAAIAAAS
jgi:hypothetical protein